MPHLVMQRADGWWIMFPIWTEPHTQRKPERGLQCSPPSPAQLLRPGSPHSLTLMPGDRYSDPSMIGSTQFWNSGDGTNGILLMKFFINLITMSKVDSYPDMPGKGRDRQCGPVCSPGRGVSFSTTFFFFLFPLAISCGMWDLSTPASDLGTGRLSLNHWTASESHNPAQFLTSLFSSSSERSVA